MRKYIKAVLLFFTFVGGNLTLEANPTVCFEVFIRTTNEVAVRDLVGGRAWVNLLELGQEQRAVYTDSAGWAEVCLTNRNTTAVYLFGGGVQDRGGTAIHYTSDMVTVTDFSGEAIVIDISPERRSGSTGVQ